MIDMKTELAASSLEKLKFAEKYHPRLSARTINKILIIKRAMNEKSCQNYCK